MNPYINDLISVLFLKGAWYPCLHAGFMKIRNKRKRLSESPKTANSTNDSVC